MLKEHLKNSVLCDLAPPGQFFSATSTDDWLMKTTLYLSFAFCKLIQIEMCGKSLKRLW